MTATKFKVKVSDFDPNEVKVPESVLQKIKKFTASHEYYTPASELAKSCRIPKPFFDAHIVCMKCGDVVEKAAYAIAQNAMGVKVIYTCECGHKTTLPQL